ncbi:hypothetical protein EVAR_82383_1 [Eumeta japonica]|uniref:Uncharacterized protein n=1 Tax=Eumeta variegata TaxID=151549 RepID=A0A4C1UA81_EUMVA|nr:hypothetical protein EVAR_82383_1 [Eumeta japonica]
MVNQYWKKLRKKLKDIEEQYAKRDHVVDSVTEEFVIRVDENSYEDDYENDPDYNDNLSSLCSSPQQKALYEPGISSVPRFYALFPFP